MKKSIYSLLLLDSVVGAIDSIAYSSGTSRSNLINRILAEYLSYTTPEMRMKSIFEELERQIAGIEAFQKQPQPSDSMFSFRSLLRFKYNPSIRYSVELYPGALPKFGELRVSSRTQSEQLLEVLDSFYADFARTEQSFSCVNNAETPTHYTIGEGRFSRPLYIHSATVAPDENSLGRAIGTYICMLDNAMKGYFEHIDNPPAATAALRDAYARYIRTSPLLL